MKRCLFIGQAMPRHKSHPHDWPTLNLWLNRIGFDQNTISQYFYYSALVDYFPGTKNGGHRVPTEDEISKERNRLKKTILEFKPEVIVPIGRLSIAHCLNDHITALSDLIGKNYFANPYGLLDLNMAIIPLPHPSGASTWYRKPANQILLQQALLTLKTTLQC